MTEDQPKVPFDLFLIGDTGDISLNRPDPVLETLKSHFDENEASGVVFLGDNIYPRGMPPISNILRKNAEKTLTQHYEALKDYNGKLIFIAGNHDWNKGRKDGYDYIIRQEQYMKKLFGDRDVFLPANGCPGPVEISLNDHLTVVAIDTQWWLQTGLRPLGKQYGCCVSTEDEFFDKLEEVLTRNSHKHVVMVGHHPVYSYAIHGGKFELKHHLFPLTLYDEGAWIPLPGIGSLIPLYRKFLGAREDIAHPRYRRLRKKLKEILAKFPGLIYASGHEHNLQYICKNSNHFIVSGSGSKVKYVVQNGKYLQFGVKAKGFFKLRFEGDGSVFLSTWVVDASRRQPKGKLVYEEKII